MSTDPRRAEAARQRFRALRIRYGDHHVLTLAAAHDLARALGTVPGEHRDCVALYFWLIDMRRQAPGPDFPITMRTVHETAEHLWRGGQPGHAAALLRDLVPRRAKILGPRHPDTLLSARLLRRMAGSRA